MRPKKKVLIYATDEAEASELGYVVWTRALAPLVAATEAGAIRTAHSIEVDCAVVLCRAARMRTEEFIRALKHARPDMPVLLVLAAPTDKLSAATMVLPRFDTALTMEALRALLARRRGPKRDGPLHPWNADLVSSKLQRVG